MRRTRTTLCQAVFAVIFAAAVAPIACGQVASLGKGHQLMVNNGLQIWGLDQGAVGFNYNNLANANFNGVMWSFGIDEDNSKLASMSNGQKWGKWVNADGNPATALDAFETSKMADMVALQVGDEQQSDIENPTGNTKAWFQAAHAGNHFPNQLLYTNSFFINSDAAFATFISDANPDAISFDSYPFDEPYGSVILPQNWLSLAGRFRRHALGSYIGLSNNAPRPYGLYLQTYAANEGPGMATRHPGDVEMRWQQFTAWTMGFTFVDAFTVGGSSSLFSGSNMSSPTEPRYSQFKESARQSMNLGPALTRLISTGYGPSIVVGKDAAGNPNPVPSDWLVFNKTNAPANQQYLTSVSATNIGTKNNGQPGDVYIGFFNPLHLDFGDPAGTTYFMITNALGPYLNDPSATVIDTMQRITLDFDFGASTINSLQRLSRDTGQIEVVPLTYLTDNKYRLVFDLEGGTGDLFKYNDGSPFVGLQLPPANAYWDNDANAGNNNLTTGAGLGGSGNWDTSANKWFKPSSIAPWAAHDKAVFWGTAGTVTLSAPQSATSLSFKTSGYTITGSTLTMTGPNITVDAGATATINSAVAGSAGLVKNGAGTLTLSGSNTHSSTAITGGALQVSSDANLGAAPGSFTAGNITLVGGTLRFGANVDISNTRGITINAGGGAIDTQGFSNPAGYNAFQGGFRGPGDLTKLGSGTFFAAATTGGLNTLWTGRLILKEGTWKIVAADGLPYNAPVGDGLQSAQVTLDGGTWQIGAAITDTNPRRGVTVAAGGGTIDTQGFNLTWAGPWAGNVTSAVLNKIGSGKLRLVSNTTYGPATYAGVINVSGGGLELINGTAMGDLAAINLANTAGVSMMITGSVAETIGSLSGGGASGGNVSLSARLTTGGNNNSTTFAGIISGAGGLTKTGLGMMQLTGANTYTGVTTVSGGTLAIDGSIAGNAAVQSGATLAGNGTIGGTTTVQSGGILSPGNSPGTITVGALTLANGSSLHMEVGPVSDRVIVGGSAALGGTLAVSLVNGFTPSLGQTFTLLTGNAVNGSFSTETLPSFSNRTFDVIYNAQSVVVQVVPALPGDFNVDGTVDAADYVTWRKAYVATFPNGYNDWRAHFGETSTSGDGSNAVPEPAAWLLLVIGAVMILNARVSMYALGERFNRLY